jgi:hypothetical protein
MNSSLGGLIVSCVDSVLDQIIGPYAKRAVLYALEADGVSLNDVVEDTARFMNGLRRFFGDGADALEDAFVHELAKEFELGATDLGLEKTVDVILGQGGRKS